MRKMEENIKMKKMKVEKYINNRGEKWTRVKFMNAAKTEVIIPEEEFEKRFGKMIEM